MTRPIEIVGGGLAGLSLGCALARAGVPTTLFEAGDYPRHRVCGEFICGLRPDVEQQLGLDVILGDACRHQRIGWHWNEKPIGANTLPRPAFGLSRHALDDRLAASFQAVGGRLITRHRVRWDEHAPGRIWATGRRGGRSLWLGLKVHCRGLQPAADLEFHLADGAYVGLSRVEGNEVNVCGLFRRCPDVRAPADEMLLRYLEACGLKQLCDRVAATQVTGTHAAVAAISFDRHPPDDRLVVGDAYAMIPPFTGDGMAMAFESAWIATEPIIAYARGAQDWPEVRRQIRRRLRRQFARRLAFACLLQRLMLAPAGQHGLAFLAQRNCLPFRLLFRWLH